MAHFSYRSGNGNEIIAPKAAGKADEAPRRARRARPEWVKEASAGWRVLALAAGREVLLCLGATRAEAAELARRRAEAGEVPEGARLLLQQWSGGQPAGEWVNVPVAQGELPTPPRRTRRSRFVGR